MKNETNITEATMFGVNLWWTVPEFVTDGLTAQGIFEKHGFEIDDLPLPSRRNIVSRAAYSFQDRRHKDGRKVTEKAKDNDEYVVYGILSQKRRGAEEVGYDQDTVIKLEKKSGRVTAVGPDADDFFKALEIYEGAITDADIRNFLRRLVKLTYGIALRQSGGIYFIPDRFKGIIDSAQNALDELGIGSKIYIQRIMNGEQEREIVWDAVETNIESQIEKTLSAVDRIEKRVSSIESHDAKLEEMNGLMDIYRQLLGEEAKHEELAEKLQDASNTVSIKLNKLQSETKTANRVTGGTDYKRSKISTSIMNDVENVLIAAHKPMHYTDIANELEKMGVDLRATKTKSKAQWTAIQIDSAVRKGNSKDIKRLGKGVYELVG